MSRTSHFNSQKRNGKSGLRSDFGPTFTYSSRQSAVLSSRTRKKRSKSQRKALSKHLKKNLKRRKFDYSIGLKEPLEVKKIF